jgi:hypothetical protein
MGSRDYHICQKNYFLFSRSSLCILSCVWSSQHMFSLKVVKDFAHLCSIALSHRCTWLLPTTLVGFKAFHHVPCSSNRAIHNSAYRTRAICRWSTRATGIWTALHCDNSVRASWNPTNTVFLGVPVQSGSLSQRTATAVGNYSDAVSRLEIARNILYS